jgi:multiple sugar transport system permease protein
VKRSLAAWMFVAPALAVLLVFFVVPVAAGLALSFTDFDLYALADLANLRFAGLDNYGHVLTLPLFWRSLGNTLYFVGAGVPLSIALSLGCAVLLQSPLARFKPLFRTALFAPVITTLVAVAVIWRYLFHVRYGLLNEWLGAFGIDPIDWLGDPHWAMPAIVLMAAWKNFGASMIIFVAGLKAIPESLYEAARLDGAGPWQRFRRITVPLLSPTFLFVGLTTTIGYFELFAEQYVMSVGDGGPMNATLSVALFMYKQGFRWWSMGSAAAIAFVLFAVILAATFLQRRLQKGGEA